MKVQKFKRGQIWWYSEGTNYDGHIQGGTRPVIIISNDIANEKAQILIGIPCTTAEKNPMPCNTTFVMNGNINTALGTNIRSLNPDKMTNYIGTCDEELLDRINECIKISLGLTEIPNDIEFKQELEKAIEKDVEETKKLAEIINDTKPVKRKSTAGRKPIYTKAYMQRYVNDYANHDIAYMMKKYKDKTVRAVTDRAYRFRKSLKENS